MTTPHIRDFRDQRAHMIGIGGSSMSGLAQMLLERQSYAIELRPTDPPVTRPLSVAFKDWDALPIASKRFIDLMRAEAHTLR